MVEREKSAQRTESYITVIFGLMTQTWETNHKQHYFITGCQISNVTLFRRLMPTDSTDWSTRPVTCSCYKKNFPLGINKVFCLWFWWFWKRLKGPRFKTEMAYVRPLYHRVCFSWIITWFSTNKVLMTQIWIFMSCMKSQTSNVKFNLYRAKSLQMPPQGAANMQLKLQPVHCNPVLIQSIATH